MDNLLTTLGILVLIFIIVKLIVHFGKKSSTKKPVQKATSGKRSDSMSTFAGVVVTICCIAGFLAILILTGVGIATFERSNVLFWMIVIFIVVTAVSGLLLMMKNPNNGFIKNMAWGSIFAILPSILIFKWFGLWSALIN